MHLHRLMQGLRPASRGASQEAVSHFFKTLCESVNSAISLKAWLLYENKEYAQLVNMQISPLDYLKADRFASDYLVVKVLSKFRGFSHEDLDPTEAALQSFRDSEARCFETNKKLREFIEDPSKRDPLMHSILQNARRKISMVLGRVDLDRISSGFGWGPGATTSVSGNRTSAYVKFKSRLDVTSNCLIMGHCCINSIPSWVNCQLQTDSFPSQEVSLTRDALFVVRGNEVVLVPKTAKTHRVIAKEPTVNVFVQRGFGIYIRDRLLSHVGIDLTDQSVNQRLAQEGSISGEIATIDLKAASDTISIEIVRALLPDKWFRLLDMARSKQGKLPNSNDWFYYQKFSSSGNGFTFELETLIFWALSKAAQESLSDDDRVLTAYGDDLIVSSDSYDRVCEVLNFAGFEVNASKSFSSGPFRESCGADYFNGTNVRPFFLKKDLSNVQELYKLANSIRRYSHRRNSYYGCDIRLLAVWKCVVSFIAEDFRGFLIPEIGSDDGLLVNFDEALPKLSRPGYGWEGFVIKKIVHTPATERMKDSHAGYTSKLYESGAEMPSYNDHKLRKMTLPKIGKLHVREWYDLGPWC
jgi:hypothetical protein